MCGYGVCWPSYLACLNAFWPNPPPPSPPLTRVPPLLLTLPPLKIHGRLSAQGSQFGSNPGRPPYTIVIRDTGLLPMHPARCLKVKIVASWGRSWVISKSRNKISNLGPRCPGVNNCASHISSRFYSLRSCHCALATALFKSLPVIMMKKNSFSSVPLQPFQFVFFC